MPTLTEEIKKVLNIYYWNHNQNPATKDLLSLIQSTVKGCVPERRDVCAWEDAMERDEFQDLGFNNAIDTITANLKDKGVL